MNIKDFIDLDVLAIFGYILSSLALFVMVQDRKIGNMNLIKISQSLTNIDKTINPQSYDEFTGMNKQGILARTRYLGCSIKSTSTVKIDATIVPPDQRS